jgi:hypothetical protein
MDEEDDSKPSTCFSRPLFSKTLVLKAEGKPIPISFTSNILEERDKEDEILEAAGAIFAGAAFSYFLCGTPLTLTFTGGTDAV